MNLRSQCAVHDSSPASRQAILATSIDGQSPANGHDRRLSLSPQCGTETTSATDRLLRVCRNAPSSAGRSSEQSLWIVEASRVRQVAHSHRPR
jgi:hypothetical protein